MPVVVKDQATEEPHDQDEAELDKGSASSTASPSSSDPASQKRAVSLVSSRATFFIGSRDTFNLDPSEGDEYRNLSPKRPRRAHSIRDDGDEDYNPTEGASVTSEGEAEEEEHDYASDDEISIGSQSPVSVSSTRSTDEEEALYSIEAVGDDDDDDARYARLLQQQEFALAMHTYHDGLNSEAEAALLGENIHPELLNSNIDMSYEGLLRLEENLGEVKRRGLEAGSLRALPRVKFSDVRKECRVTGDSLCSICMTEYDAKDVLVKLTCDHLFHKDCAVGWLQVRATCPVCRETIPEHVAL